MKKKLWRRLRCAWRFARIGWQQDELKLPADGWWKYDADNRRWVPSSCPVPAASGVGS
jgi:deoxyribodipyrimidine photolyase-like uncharacterized protein